MSKKEQVVRYERGESLRYGHTPVPNHRWNDTRLDSYDLHVAGWLQSHADQFRETVTRNSLARDLNLSGERASKSLAKLEKLGIIKIEKYKDENLTKMRFLFCLGVWVNDRNALCDIDHVSGRHTTASDCHTTADQSPHDRSTNIEKNSREEHISNTGHFEKEFDEFWNLQTNKVHKPRAKKIYIKLLKEDYNLHNIICEAMRAENAAREAHLNAGQFFPNPAGPDRWLGDQYWTHVHSKIAAAQRTDKGLEYLKLAAEDPRQNIGTQFGQLSDKFIGTYGRAWTCNFDDEHKATVTRKEWLRILYGLDQITFEKALNLVSTRDKYLSLPPKSSEFLSLYREISPAKMRAIQNTYLNDAEKARREKETAADEALLDNVFPQWREILQDYPSGMERGRKHSQLLEEARKLSRPSMIA